MAGEVRGIVWRALRGITVALLLSLSPVLCNVAAGKQVEVVKLVEGKSGIYVESQNFCYQKPYEPKWHDIWTKVQIRVNSTKMIRVTQVDSEEQLLEMESFNVFNLFSFLKEKLNDTYINVDLHSNKTCIKVHVNEADTRYSVVLSRGFDPKLFMVFLLGLLLFFYGDTLSRSQLFYYSTGVSVGMVASMLILVFMLSKLLPKKSSFYMLLVGGWSFSLYIIQLVVKNFQGICTEYWQYLLGYLCIVGFVSFAVCYRYGPLENERSINLLNWTLQLIGLLLMYVGVQVRHVALSMMAIAFCTKQIEYPVHWAYSLYRKVLKSRVKPSPPRLLTEEEYRKQGELETRKALEELREYCSSPDSQAWRIVSRIQSPKRYPYNENPRAMIFPGSKDRSRRENMSKPEMVKNLEHHCWLHTIDIFRCLGTRFADFVEGSSHLSPNEVSIHEHEYGLGGSFLEQELFGEGNDMDTDDNDDEEMDYEIHQQNRFMRSPHS